MSSDLETLLRSTLHARAEAIGHTELRDEVDLSARPEGRSSRVLIVGVAAAIILLIGGLVAVVGRPTTEVVPAAAPPAGVFASAMRYAPMELTDDWTVSNAQDIALSNSGTSESVVQTWLGPIDATGDTTQIIEVRSTPSDNTEGPSDQILQNVTTTGAGADTQAVATWTDDGFLRILHAQGLDIDLVRAFALRLQADSQRTGFVRLTTTPLTDEPDPFGELAQQDERYSSTPVFAWGSTITISDRTDDNQATLFTAPRSQKHLETYTADGVLVTPGQRASVVTANDGALTLSWTNGTAVFSLSGQLSVETLTTIASSIERADDGTWSSLQQTAARDYLSLAPRPDVTGVVADMTVAVFDDGDATTLCGSFTDGTQRCSTYRNDSDLRAAIAVRGQTALVYGWTGSNFESSSGDLTVNGHRIDTANVDGQQLYAFPVPPNPTQLEICHPQICGSLLGFG